MLFLKPLNIPTKTTLKFFNTITTGIKIGEYKI